MNKLLREFLSYILLKEYTEEEKRAMGIPPGAVARGKFWYTGDIYAGQVINGKFVKAKPGEQPSVDGASTDEKDRADAGRAVRQGGKETTPAGYLAGRSAAYLGPEGRSGVSIASRPITIVGKDGKESTQEVRDILDENGNPIDVTTDTGRKATIERISAIIEHHKVTTQQAIRDLSRTDVTRAQRQQAHHWLGEIGELSTLREVLSNGVPGYLAAANNDEWDIIAGESDEGGSKMKICELSVKSARKKADQKQGVGSLGSNGRSIFKTNLEDKTSFVAGIDGPIDALVAMNAVYDVREILGKIVSDNIVYRDDTSGKNLLDIPEKMLTPDRFTEDYIATYTKARAEGTLSVLGNQALFLRNRKITQDDLKTLRERLVAQKIPENLIDLYVGKVEQRMKEGVRDGDTTRPLVVSDLEAIMMESIGELHDNTDPPTDFIVESDLVSVIFNEETGQSEIFVSRAQSVRDCLQAKESTLRQSDKTVQQVFPDRDVAPNLADEPISQVLTSTDDACTRFDRNGKPNGLKWICQVRRYSGPTAAQQARVSKGKQSDGRRRGNIQVKTNVSHPADCVKSTRESMGAYLGRN